MKRLSCATIALLIASTTASVLAEPSRVAGPLGLPESVPAFGLRVGLDFQRHHVAFDLADPGAVVPHAPPLETTLWSATFVRNDFGKQYMLGEGNILRTVATDDGTVTDIGPVEPPVAGDYWLAIAWNPVDETVYAGACNHGVGLGCRLYTLDLDTLALNLVGDIGGSDQADFFLMDMAFDSQGRLYAINLTDAYPVALIEIDPATAAVTVIGTTGVPAQYAQGIDFDRRDDTLYWTAFGPLGAGGAYGGKVYTVDTATAIVTEIGTTPGEGEVWALSIATEVEGVSDGIFCSGFEQGEHGACD